MPEADSSYTLCDRIDLTPEGCQLTPYISRLLTIHCYLAQHKISFDAVGSFAGVLC